MSCSLGAQLRGEFTIMPDLVDFGVQLARPYRVSLPARQNDSHHFTSIVITRFWI